MRAWPRLEKPVYKTKGTSYQLVPALENPRMFGTLEEEEEHFTGGLQIRAIRVPSTKRDSIAMKFSNKSIPTYLDKKYGTSSESTTPHFTLYSVPPSPFSLYPLRRNIHL